MNVFILSTGRCGSTTFEVACRSIGNYTAGHETRTAFLGEQRLAYPANHIESDNRLSWFLGRLDRKYGKQAFYVHLTRARDKVARSYAKRYRPGAILFAYGNGVLLRHHDMPEHLATRKAFTLFDLAADYVDTVNENIEMFLKDKTNKMTFSLENYERDFPLFWEAIGAAGDFEHALKAFSVQHNRPLLTCSVLQVARPCSGPPHYLP